jgi:NAD(P)H-flavin reductase/ferredoxin
MTLVRYEGKTFEVSPKDSLLDSLNAQGADIPSSCRSGLCQTCLLQARSGVPPESSQSGLQEDLRLEHYFLACLCYPEEDLEVSLQGGARPLIPARVIRLERLSKTIRLVALKPEAPMTFRAGQFIHLFQDKEIFRSYSIASIPSDDEIHLHVKLQPDGEVSGWVHESLKVDQIINLSGPLGHSFYVGGQPEQPLLLIGTGAGLAPLFGILRDALSQGHTGPIKLFHGSRHPQELYLGPELKELSIHSSHFEYRACVSGDEAAHPYERGRASDLAFQELSDLRGWRIFLSGHPVMVKESQMTAFLAGASLRDIHIDPFTFTQVGSDGD